MRTLKLLGVVLLGVVLSTGARAEKIEAVDQARIDVVLEMVDAWNTMNWDRVVELFTDDGVLHSVMVEPIKGREAIGARIAHIGEGISSITLNVKHIGVIDDVVFVERVDEFVYNGHAGKVPVVGVLEIENGRVKEWREYYDREELLREMGLAEDFDADAR